MASEDPDDVDERMKKAEEAALAAATLLAFLKNIL